jgi:hypothetical protein
LKNSELKIKEMKRQIQVIVSAKNATEEKNKEEAQ